MSKIKNKPLRILIKVMIAFTIMFIFMVIGLSIYASFSYEASEDMYDTIALLDTSDITTDETIGAITYTVDSPLKQIIIVPGGLVDPASYRYLAISLASNQYNVTIIKPMFNLAIIAPNQPARYINPALDNIIIGHSLGGVVGAMVAAKEEKISAVVLLASYATTNISQKDVLSITAENDLVLDHENYQKNLDFLGEDATFFIVEGGTHAQFGWYGKQSGDGEPSITTKAQQDLIVTAIVSFIN